MKKRRRVEITTFRSRTTMTVRNQPESSPAEALRHTNTFALVPADLPQAEQVDLKQRRLGKRVAGLDPIKQKK